MFFLYVILMALNWLVKYIVSSRVPRPWIGISVVDLYGGSLHELEILNQKFPHVVKGVIVKQVCLLYDIGICSYSFFDHQCIRPSCLQNHTFYKFHKIHWYRLKWIELVFQYGMAIWFTKTSFLFSFPFALFGVFTLMQHHFIW